MVRYHHRVDGPKAKDDPDRVQLVPFTTEEEAARDVQEAQTALDKAAKATQLQNDIGDFETLMISLRAGKFDADDMSLLADVLERLRPA